MRKPWRGIVAAVLAASCVFGGRTAGVTAATTPPPVALAYVLNGQVAVQESGALNQVGPGQNPVWSPNGANLAYIVANFALDTADLYLTDTHGANSHRVMTHLYPFVSPSWSPDSKYLVYTVLAGGAKPGAGTATLEVRALRVADGKVQVLGHIPFFTSCGLTVTALQTAEARAQGAYYATPTTVIWAQPSRVVVQSGCSGTGLSIFTTGGGKVTTLKGWSGGVLSPDGKAIAAVVAGHGSAQVGLISTATGKTQVLGPKLSPTVLTWSHNSKIIYAASEPSNPRSGSAQLYFLSSDGTVSGSLTSIQASGIYHLSVDPTGQSLAMAVVASASATAQAPPQVLIYTASVLKFGQAAPLIGAGEPAWRP